VAAVYYANTGWTRVHGGQLQLYTPAVFGESPAPYVDLKPVADRLVLFFSDTRTLHEVLPAHVDRSAATV